jgi:hypothetical protein
MTVVASFSSISAIALPGHAREPLAKNMHVLAHGVAFEDYQRCLVDNGVSPAGAAAWCRGRVRGDGGSGGDGASLLLAGKETVDDDDDNDDDEDKGLGRCQPARRLPNVRLRESCGRCAAACTPAPRRPCLPAAVTRGTRHARAAARHHAIQRVQRRRVLA